MNDILLAEYMIGRCCQGFDYIAIYLAATLYERLICNKVKQKNPALFKEITSDPQKTFNDIIKAVRDHMGLRPNYQVGLEKQLSVEEVFRYHNFFHMDGKRIQTKEEAYNKLRYFKDVRNAIIHAENLESFLRQRERDAMDLMLYVASEYCPKFFQDTLAKIPTRDITGLRKILDEKHSDYIVRSVDEVMIKRFDKAEGKNRKNWKIEEKDFSNLFHLRQKLVPLKNTLDSWLGKNYPKLTTTILTTIDTASAYIWLPIVHIDGCKANLDRPNLKIATASILVTPLDLRIYIDFGGQCFLDRKEYFKFIRKPNGEFSNFLSNLDDSAREKFFVFDVEWYSFISRKITIESILNDWPQWEKTVKAADKELDQIKNDQIITTNSLLSGFIIDREWIKENGPIKEDYFLEKLSQIIDLYYSLLLNKQFDQDRNE